jgi:hypothetical protein
MSRATQILLSRVKVLASALESFQAIPPGSAAWGSIGGTLSEQGDLAGVLGGKAPASHDHGDAYARATHAHDGFVADNDARLSDARLPIAHEHQATDISGTAVVDGDARLSDARTPTTHAHAQADVTGLGTALEGKAAIDHTHDATGSDPWTVVKLGADFSTTNATNTNVTGLAFTPAINKTYYVLGCLMLRTATATVGARPGIAWPSNLTDGTARVEASTSLTASVLRSWGAKTTQNAASTGLATTTDSHFGGIEALLVTGASTSGDFQITLASETAGTSVAIRAGSFIMYRTID